MWNAGHGIDAKTSWSLEDQNNGTNKRSKMVYDKDRKDIDRVT